jgi:hypothetical protein
MHFFIFLLASIVAGDQIHGKEVPTACFQAYQAAFEPELNRTSKFMALIKVVTTPPELQQRAVKAGEALQAYQTALKKVDSDLSAPISEADHKALSETQKATEDIVPFLRDLSNNTDDGIKAALKEFREARLIELRTNAVVDKECPPDIE